MRILVLSTYPIQDPKHGGQHRLANIVRLLRDKNHTVTTVGVLGGDHYAQDEGYMPYPGLGLLKQYLENPFLMDDWAIGELYSKNDEYFHQLASLVGEKPDVIHVEQCWLFKFALRYRNEFCPPTTKIVYGSQNIEYQLKFGILKKYMGSATAENGANLVKECELYALSNADLVCCVSEGDLLWSSVHVKGQIVLAQNGVKDVSCSLDDLREASRLTSHKKYAVYCASAHPPNIDGFYDVFGRGVGCFSPDERLVVVGSAGASIASQPQFQKTPGLRNVYIDAGMVSDSLLKGLIHNAHAIILPITHGGGTNLKTAEALWAGRHIVSTTTAMRGFEKFMQSPGVNVSPSSREFCGLIRDVMIKPRLKLNNQEIGERKAVLWEETLRKLVDSISCLEFPL